MVDFILSTTAVENEHDIITLFNFILIYSKNLY